MSLVRFVPKSTSARAPDATVEHGSRPFLSKRFQTSLLQVIGTHDDSKVILGIEVQEKGLGEFRHL